VYSNLLLNIFLKLVRTRAADSKDVFIIKMSTTRLNLLLHIFSQFIKLKNKNLNSYRIKDSHVSFSVIVSPKTLLKL
jgi:hypothetical protein